MNYTSQKISEFPWSTRTVYSLKIRRISDSNPPRCLEITVHPSSYHAHAPMFLSQSSWKLHTWYQDSGPVLKVLSCRLHTDKKSYNGNSWKCWFSKTQTVTEATCLCIASHLFQLAQLFKLQLYKTTWDGTKQCHYHKMKAFNITGFHSCHKWDQKSAGNQCFQWDHLWSHISTRWICLLILILVTGKSLLGLLISLPVIPGPQSLFW